MPIRPIIDIEINDGAWTKFQSQFKQYQDALAQQPKSWDEATKAIDGSRKSFDDLVGASSVRLQHARLIAEAEKVASETLKKQSGETARQAHSWHDMAKDTKAFATNIGHATTSLLRWAGITGIISGVLGAGGLFGIDRLAASAGNQRRSSLGLGVTPGEKSSFETNLGRIIDPDAVLGGVNDALHDPRKAAAFGGLGLDYGNERLRGTYEASIDSLRALKRLADQTPDANLGPTFDARRLGDLGYTKEQFQRVKATPLAELLDYLNHAAADKNTLNLTGPQAKAWQDLQVQLGRASREIERTFVIGLTGLAGPIGHLSESVVTAVGAFAASPRIKSFLDEAATSLDHFATEVGTPTFAKSVQNFADDMGTLAANLRNDLPGITTVFGAIAAFGNGLGAVAGPWINGRPPDPNNPLPNDPPGLQPNKTPPPFSWWNPGTWLDHAPGTGPAPRPSPFPGGAGPAPSTFHGKGSPAAFRPTIGPSPLATGNRVNEAHDFFRAAGWSEAQTAGILANLGTESGFRPDAFNGAGGGQGAQGIAQWRGPRIAEFQRLTGHDLRHASYEEQLAFVQWELTHSEKGAGDKLRAVGDARQAGSVVNQYYERSGTNGRARARAAGQYQQQFRDRSVQVQVHNNTGGNANITISQLAAT